MMIFYVSADFDLDQKPNWLDDFRKKYDEPYEYHITLKNSAYTEEKNIDEIKMKLGEICKRYKPFSISFTQLFHDKTRRGETIMIKADGNQTLMALQKEVSISLKQFGPHIKDYYKTFEENFNPHVTIGRHLNDEQFIKAMSEIQTPINCTAQISKIVLTTSRAQNLIEVQDSIKNVTFKLST
jgi:2'-5' RNA ligase